MRNGEDSRLLELFPNGRLNDIVDFLFLNLNECIGSNINSSSSLIEYEDLGPSKERSGQTDELSLTNTEFIICLSR